MGQRAVQEFKGRVNLGGVGYLTTKSDHGIYQVKIPLHNGENATISGVCLERLPQISQAIHFKVNLNKIQFKHLKEQRKGFQNNYLRYRYRLYDCDKIFALLSRKDI